jgi:DNA replication protein DnaC
MLWTVVTSNLTLDEIEAYHGARIASRLSEMTVLNIKLPDYRKKRAS